MLLLGCNLDSPKLLLYFLTGRKELWILVSKKDILAKAFTMAAFCRSRRGDECLCFMLACCRFVFEADALEVVVASKEQEETENAFVGGRNRWSYDTFTNWEFWWPGFPVLVYFKVSTLKQLYV